MNTPAPIRVSHGSSPVEPIDLVTIEWDDDVESAPGTRERAQEVAESYGLSRVEDTPDGVRTWRR